MKTKPIHLTKQEIELLKSSLYMLREYARARAELARESGNEREANRQGVIIRAALALDDKLEA